MFGPTLVLFAGAGAGSKTTFDGTYYSGAWSGSMILVLSLLDASRRALANPLWILSAVRTHALLGIARWVVGGADMGGMVDPELVRRQWRRFLPSRCYHALCPSLKIGGSITWQMGNTRLILMHPRHGGRLTACCATMGRHKTAIANKVTKTFPFMTDLEESCPPS